MGLFTKFLGRDPIKRDTKRFVKELRDGIGLLGWAVEGLRESSSHVPSLDPSWKLKTYLDTIEKTHGRIEALTPPPSGIEVHAAWLKAAESFRVAARILKQAIEGNDQGKIDSAAPLLARANMEAEEAASRLQYFMTQ